MLPWLESQRPAMLDLLRTWVEFETPSLEPDRVARFAKVVAAEFEQAGCRPTFHPHALQLDYGSPGGTRDPVLVLGHLDTVYPAGTLAHMPFRMAESRAYGPGTFDMKGGLVQALFALRALRTAGAAAPPGRLTFLFVHDEEIGSRGSRGLTERLAGESGAVLVLEPAAEGGKLKTARKGIALYTLAAQGHAAHAGVDFEKGASAVVELAARVAEIAAWTDCERGITLNPGVIGGGTRANVIAAEAHVELDVRAWSAADLEQNDRRLRGLASANPRVRLTLEGGINRPPMESSRGGEALFARAQALGRKLGLELEATRTGGGSDGNFTAALGVPTLDGLGMVGEGAHAPHENVRVDHLVPRTALLASLLAAARRSDSGAAPPRLPLVGSPLVSATGRGAM